MHFNGALEMLSPTYHLAETLFAHLTSLTTLNVSQELWNTQSQVDLTHFPSSLRFLRLVSGEEGLLRLWYAISDLTRLPPLLETLVLHLAPQREEFDVLAAGTGRDPLVIGEGVPGELSMLTHLSLWVSEKHPLETKLIAANLTYLDAAMGEVLFDGHPVLDPACELTPARCFPRLETLRFYNTHKFLWPHLRRFPPTLTSLGASMDPGFDNFNQQEYDSDQVRYGVILNEFNQNTTSPPAHAIPKNLRFVENFPDFAESPVLEQHLKHFPNLVQTKPCAPYLSWEMDLLTNFPSNFQTLELSYLDILNIPQLPKSITRLLIDKLEANTTSALEIGPATGDSMPTKVQLPNPIFQPPVYTMPSLSELEIHNSIDNVTIDTFPSSLEKLSIRSSDINVFKYFTTCANSGRFPLLKELSLRTSRAFAHDSILELSLETVPLHLQTLHAHNMVIFSRNPCLRLVDHPSLTCLRIYKPIDPLRLLPEVPSGLKYLLACLHPALDFNHCDSALTLYDFGRRMYRLKVMVMFTSPQVDSPNCIIPITKFHSSPVSIRRWLSLPYELKKLYALRSLPFIHSDTLNHASELFAFSCLPRTLSTFKVPDGTLRSSMDYGFDILQAPALFKAWIGYPALRYFVPFIRSFNPPLDNDEYGTTFRACLAVDAAPRPPQLSTTSGGKWTEHTIVHSLLYGKVTGFPSSQLWARRRSEYPAIHVAPTDTGFHLSNCLIWLFIALYMPITRKNHPILWYYQWANILGSALALPVVWRRWRKSVNSRAQNLYFANHVHFSLKSAFAYSAFIGLVANSAIVAPAVLKLGLPSKILFGSVAVLLSLARNYFFHVSN